MQLYQESGTTEDGENRTSLIPEVAKRKKKINKITWITKVYVAENTQSSIYAGQYN